MFEAVAVDADAPGFVVLRPAGVTRARDALGCRFSPRGGGGGVVCRSLCDAIGVEVWCSSSTDALGDGQGARDVQLGRRCRGAGRARLQGSGWDHRSMNLGILVRWVGGGG